MAVCVSGIWAGSLRASVFLCSPAPPSEVTFRAVAADLLHSLLAGGGAPCVLKLHSLFVLDENSCPLQREFSLLDLYPDSGEPGPSALL